MNVSMHQKISRIFADSLLTFTAIHTPRQTIQLAKTDRQNNCSQGRFIFISVTLSTKALMPLKAGLFASRRPPRTTINATRILPARLPSQVQHQFETSSP